jgi:hypothetical protein
MDGQKSCFAGSEVGKVLEDNGLGLWKGRARVGFVYFGGLRRVGFVKF